MDLLLIFYLVFYIVLNLLKKNIVGISNVKVKEIIKIIEIDGWYIVRQKGSHRQYKHNAKSGLVTISAHALSDDIALGTLKSILKQAQINLDK